MAVDVWTKKTGLDPIDDPASTFPRHKAQQPTGAPVKETEAHLAKRYPKLWKRFGESPWGSSTRTVFPAKDGTQL